MQFFNDLIMWQKHKILMRCETGIGQISDTVHIRHQTQEKGLILNLGFDWLIRHLIPTVVANERMS